MTLQQAIKEAQEKDIWLRPVSWEGSGFAYAISNNRLCVAPSRSGLYPATSPLIECLLGEWQAVTPDIVNEEEE